MDKSEIAGKIISLIKNRMFQFDRSREVKVDDNLAHDLSLKPFDLIELYMSIEDEFDIEIPDYEAEKLYTIAHYVDYVKNKIDMD